MYKLEYFDLSGVKQGHVEFKPDGLPEKPNKKLLHEMVILYERNKRQGTAHTKVRSEVSGSTRKPWRQKGLGRARVGTIRSPIWRGGGTVFGPRHKNYNYHIPVKMKRAATKHALAGKLNDDEIKIIENIKAEKPKTRDVSNILREMSLSGRLLLITKESDKNLYLSARNIPKVSLMPYSQVNSYELLRHKYCVFTMTAFETIFGVASDSLKVVKGPAPAKKTEAVKKEQEKQKKASARKGKGKPRPSDTTGDLNQERGKK